jgi:putative ABC transport system ATP-binding protein
MRPAQRDRFRADNIGLIFQSLNLIPYLTAMENIVLPLRFAPGRLKAAGGWSAARRTAEAMLADIGLPLDQHGQLPSARLSVGQQQRVAVLRAIGAPGLIIADEPTSALDADRRAAFLEMLGTQLQRTGAALLMVSHDREIGRHFDRTVALETIVRTERMP